MTIETNRADVLAVGEIKTAKAALANEFEDVPKGEVDLHDTLLQPHHLGCCGVHTLVSELRIEINYLSKQLEVALKCPLLLKI